MSVTGPLSHIDISVGVPEKSIPFYHALLTSIGYRRWDINQPQWTGDNPSRATWGIQYADGSRFGIEVRPARTARPYDRYEPGPHHMAFHADSESSVNQAHRAIVAIGGDVLDPPTDYGGHPAYGDQYYAAFFADPDGVKLEVCYVKTQNP